MRKLLFILFLLGVFATGCSEDMLDDLKNFIDNVGGGSSATIQNNEIWYTNGSTQEATEIYDEEAFDVNVVSNSYNSRNKCWVIEFDGEVTTIGKRAFYARTALTSVVIPSSVTSIETEAFTHCSSLKRFVGKFASEDGRALIVDSKLVAFAQAGLTEYTIPEDVTEIDDSVFSDCTDLKSVVISDSVTAIGERAFEMCCNLESVVLSENLRSIGDYAFMDCSSLTSVTIPDSVTTIGISPFINCRGLQEFKGKFTSNDGRVLVVDGKLVAFAPAGLTEYIIPDGVTEIDESVFLNCNNLNRVAMPDSVTSIGESSFAYCGNLREITLSNRLSTIGSGAFVYCHTLSEITLPNSLKTIGDSAFGSCYAISDIDIPYGVETIDRSAFSFSGLTRIVIPDSVTSLGDNLFEGCQELKSAVFGNGVTTIPNYAFFKCDNLSQVTLGDNVSTIGELAFKYCGLQRITLPESLTAISERAFRMCTCLKEVYCKATTPPTAIVNSYSWSAFDDNDMERLIYVPEQSVNDYKLADGWRGYADAIVGYVYE